MYKMSGAIDGAIYGPQFDSLQITDSTDLFIDDQPTNVVDVQNVANYNGLNLKSVLCLPTQMTLYGCTDGIKKLSCSTDKIAYIARKRNDPEFTDEFKIFLPEPRQSHDIGTGITREIIRKIIENETASRRTGLYFFDFDMLLSQFGGLDFPKNPESVTAEWLEQYAKYLFSDCIGQEPPETGRLSLLKSMFALIGPERIYIITANPCAYDQDPSRDKFIKLIRVLLPTFIPDHLVYARSNKGVAIYDFASRLAGGGAKSKARKTRSKARRTKSKAKRTNCCSRKKSRRLS